MGVPIGAADPPQASPARREQAQHAGSKPDKWNPLIGK